MIIILIFLQKNPINFDFEELNQTLKKTINSASEETVLNAIEAYKEALVTGKIERPGGWLKKAIYE